MPTIEQLRTQVSTTWDRMEAIMASARSDGDRALNDDERTEYDRLEGQLRMQRRDAERAEAHERTQAAAAEPTDARVDPDPTPRAAATVGEHFANHVGDAISAARGSRFTVEAPEWSPRAAATDTQVTDGNTGALGPVLTEVDTNVVTAPRRRMTIEDLCDSGTLSGQAITYFIEGALEGDFTTVAENGQKPQLHFVNPTAQTDALKKIAGFIKESDEVIEDLPFLVSAINNRLLYQLDLFTENQILSGNGTGTNLRGILNRSQVQTMGLSTDAKAGNPDLIFKAITAVSTAADLEADGIVINPVDYQDFRLRKDGNDQYMGGGFFSGQYGVNGILQEPPLWGKRTVVTPAIAAGTVLVGAFRAAATVYTKGGTRVEATNSHDTDFTNNRVTIRAERRKALAVRRPTGFVKVTLGAA